MDGDLCGCGSAAGFLVSQKQAGSCLMECTGEEDGRIEMCGGSASFDLFKIVYSDTAGGFYTLFSNIYFAHPICRNICVRIIYFSFSLP